jgi:hypothetical protein
VLQGSGAYRLSNLRRGCYGTRSTSHAIGASVISLDTGLLRVPIDHSRYGTTVRIKLVSFNLSKTFMQDTATVPWYDYQLPSGVSFKTVQPPPFKATFETFDTSKWEVITPTGPVAVAYGVGVSGGAVLRCTGQTWMAHRALIPYDPARTYQLIARFRQQTNPTAGSKSVYFGLVGVGADGLTLVNMTGVNGFGSQHYVSMSSPTQGVWNELSGYWRGVASPGTAGGASPSAPGTLHTNVRYVRLLCYVNEVNTDGVVDVDSVALIEAADSVVQAATDASAALVLAGTKTRVFYQAAAPTSGMVGGDIWFNTDTTTNCSDPNCKGHTLDGNGNPNVGSYPHRGIYWPHGYDGSTFINIDRTALIVAQEIAAGAIVADKIAANALSSGDYAEDSYGAATAGARLRNIYATSNGAWSAGLSVTAGEIRTRNGKVFRCRTSGTTNDGTGYSAVSMSTTYSAGNKVTFGANTYRSLQSNNTGHLPYDGSGKSANDAWWANEGHYQGPDYYGGRGIPDGTAMWDQIVPLSVSPDGIQIGVLSQSEKSMTENIVYAGSFSLNTTTNLFNYSAGTGPLRISYVSGTNTILIEYPLPVDKQSAVASVFFSERYNASGSVSPKGWSFARGMGTDPAPTQPSGWTYTYGQLINSSAAAQTPGNGYRCSFSVALL